MRTKIVAANWKMNGPKSQLYDLVNALKTYTNITSTLQLILLPPAIYLPLVNEWLGGVDTYTLGAQNIYPKDFGAYTGELSIPMIKEFNCRYVLVGHSERRHYFHEDENFIAQKFHHVKDHGMIPILCVGETLIEREKGYTEEVIAKQLAAVSMNNKTCFKHCIIAYEPVWAIGTGQTATPEHAQDIHYYIRSLVRKVNTSDAEHLSILYGGSVNENNAKALFSMPDIDGGLIGNASLNAQQFLEIVKCIN